ncbi:helitron helicase-like domain-containing protein [Nocardia niigatensis]|uniref:helitron helicase-like domain-containing protein n=1 Tax=Nocardia niigatensis TaxID=209249 RepID=UPI0002E1DC48|nr:helitron helicase-like domain-containing protein [Nocardia niigatensis]
MTDTTEPAASAPAESAPARQTAAERRALPNMVDIAEAAAEKYGVCKRPIPMRAFDPDTGQSTYVGGACKSTRASDCPSCAAKARALRFTQCREGWHLPEEPIRERNAPSEYQQELLTARADLLAGYKDAREQGDEEAAESFREVIADLDRELRASGISGRIKPIDAVPKPRRTRSTKRRQDVPNLPRKKIEKTTLGREFAGRHRPSMFLTVTMDSYGRCHRDGALDRHGKVVGDGSPVDPETYDYRRAARDAMFFPKLFDRFIQNYRRAAGRDVQYFAAVEPQRRGAPHAHIAVRGTDPHALINQVIAASYHSVWWPHFDHEQYSDDRMPVWDPTAGAFVDPDNGYVLPTFDDAQALMDEMDELEPAHVVRWGVQVDRKDIGDTDPDGEQGPVRPGKAKGVLGGGDANKLIGYLTKYLTKSIAEVLEPPNERTRRHYERLHAEMCRTPCSEKCGVWLRYGIAPRGASAKTQPGRCKGKAHRRDTLGLRGRRVLVSRHWSNKTLPDHKADRIELVRQTLAAAGIAKEERSKNWVIRLVEPGDLDVPPREHLIMGEIARRSMWEKQLLEARMAVAHSPGLQHVSTIDTTAA